jgi:hypothetical protein
VQHCLDVHELERRGLTEQYLEERSKAGDRAEKAIARKMLRRAARHEPR